MSRVDKRACSDACTGTKTGAFYPPSSHAVRARSSGEGRLINDYTEEALEQLLVEVGGWEVLRVWRTADVRSGREVRWVNLLARRV